MQDRQREYRYTLQKTPLVAFFLAYPTTPAYPPSAELGAVGGSHVHVMAYKAEKAE